MKLSDRAAGLVFIFLMLIVSLAFQLQSKQLATELSGTYAKIGGSGRSLFQFVLNEIPWGRLLIVLGLAGLTFILWLLALARLELSFALVFASAGLAFSIIASGLILNEPITMYRISGIVLITAGLITTAMS